MYLFNKLVHRLILLLVVITTLLDGNGCRKAKLYKKKIKFINLHLPINAMTQRMIRDGHHGGYWAKYWNPHYGKVKQFKYPFELHAKVGSV